MKVHHLRRGVLAVLACGPLLAGLASAQPAGQAGPASVAQSFDELKGRIQPGATIFVTDSAGHEVRGTLSELSDSSLELLVHGKPHAFSRDEVAIVKHRQSDSLWNGLLIGAAAGVAHAVYWLVVDPNECGGSICMQDLVMGVVPSAAIGLGIDAALRRKAIVYRRPSMRSTGKAITVAPIAVQRRKGVELTVSF